ncbi:hypothetical protein TNCV_3000241 [Trichonephila clavipes]|nr:hypothetical protein TNCV_3000241 [Trichonephila clavipes]
MTFDLDVFNVHQLLFNAKLLWYQGSNFGHEFITMTMSYTRAFSDGPRDFGQMTRATPELAPPLLTTTPHQREDISALHRFNVHRCPTQRVFCGTVLELETCQP